jgi:hypothetical protein
MCVFMIFLFVSVVSVSIVVMYGWIAGTLTIVGMLGLHGDRSTGSRYCSRSSDRAAGSRLMSNSAGDRHPLGEGFLPVTCPRPILQSNVESAEPRKSRRMRKNRFTEAQIIEMIKEQEACPQLRCAVGTVLARRHSTSLR